MTVHFRATLLKPLDQQQDRDGDRIDPAGVEFDPEAWYIVTPNFDHTMPPMGRAKIHRGEDGSLVVEGELFQAISSEKENPKLKAAIGVIAEKEDYVREFVGRVLSKSKLMPEVVLTAEHADPTQPPIEIIRRDKTMNLTRDGHYHTPSGADEQGTCRAAKVVHVVQDDPIRAIVNLVVWEQDGDSTEHLGVQQDDAYAGIKRGESTFHLSMECPFGK